MRSFAPFALLLLAIAALMRISALVLVVYFLIAVYILARIWSNRSPSQLAIQRRFGDRAFTGDQLPVALEIRNTGMLPIPWLLVDESIPTELVSEWFERQVISLGPRETKVFPYVLHCRRRGYFHIGPLTLQTGDVLDVSRRTLRCDEPRPLIVYPRVVPLDRLGLPTHSALAALPARSPLIEDPTRIIGIRDYQQGDTLRRVHWPATARSGKLVVKRYQPAIARDTLIILDINPDSYGRSYRYDGVELAIVAAASVASHVILNEKLPAGLVTEGRDPMASATRRVRLPPSAERSGLIGILEVLARIESDRSITLSDMVRQERPRLSWGTTVMLITGDGSENVLEQALLLQRGGFAVAIVLVQPGPTGAIHDGLPPRGVSMHRIWSEQALAVAL